LAIFGAIGCLSLTWASFAAAEEDNEPAVPERAAPPRDLPAPSTRYSLALTGVGVTAGFYGAALGASLIWSNGPWAPELRIPIAGPWMAMHEFKCNGEHPCGTPLVVARGILAGIDGVGQAGGILIALESLFLPVQSSSRARSTESPKHAWVRPVPLLSRDTIGLGFVGQL
jgi:hypothetical protein